MNTMPLLLLEKIIARKACKMENKLRAGAITIAHSTRLKLSHELEFDRLIQHTL